MKVTLSKNYEKGNKRLLKGVAIEVTPWFFVELDKGGYLLKKMETVGNKKVQTKN